MTHRALGSVFTFILLNCIKQGRQDPEMLHYKSMEAQAGQNVALHCAVESSSVTYIGMIEWSKGRHENQKLAVYNPTLGLRLFPTTTNVTLVVEEKTMASDLHLHEVTKSDSGIYICGLSTFPLGSIRQATELKVTDVANGTEKSFTESAESSSTPSLTDRHSTAGPQSTDVSTDAKHGPNTSHGFTTTGGNATSYVNDTQSRVTSAPATSPDVFHPPNHQGTRTTLTAFTDQSPASPDGDASTRYGGTESISTRGARDDTTLQTVQPEIRPSTSLEDSSDLRNITDLPGNTHVPTAMTRGDRISNDNEGAARNHLTLAVTIVPVLVLLAVVGFLCRKRMIKQRMDRPPPFKPPPPPVKYTSPRQTTVCSAQQTHYVY